MAKIALIYHHYPILALSLKPEGDILYKSFLRLMVSTIQILSIFTLLRVPDGSVGAAGNSQAKHAAVGQ